MPVSIERILDQQMRLWQIQDELRRETGPDAPPPRRPVITLSRQLGAGHEPLALGLADRLGLQVHGRSLIDAVARDEGLKRRVAESLDERTRTELDIWVESLLDRRLFSHDVFHTALARVIRALAAHGGVVFVGRGANRILEGTDCLRVRVVAPREVRIGRVAAEDGVDEREAARRVDASDRERAAFVRRLFRADWDDATAYDLVLNTDRLEAERLVDVVVEAGRARGLFAEKHTPGMTIST